jgi:hypothetical protein
MRQPERGGGRQRGVTGTANTVCDQRIFGSTLRNQGAMRTSVLSRNTT